MEVKHGDKKEHRSLRANSQFGFHGRFILGASEESKERIGGEGLGSQAPNLLTTEKSRAIESLLAGWEDNNNDDDYDDDDDDRTMTMTLMDDGGYKD